ncbi:hypothetical protein QBC47DRAFT_456092 [Echria macrotheca]|uniref:Uncharacterized protein n=1 Tax=Echria macrotheca TaxID=438768 RepID=A0AAJ0BL89_9PEZI|nr:hypothetical protein QBC47DRAFT_456092 [Echria macrotheca]
MSSDQKNLRSKMEHTLRALLQSPVEASAANDPSLLSTVLDPACKRYIQPASLLSKLGAPPDFFFDVPSYEAAIGSEMAVFSVKGVEVDNVCVDVEGRKGSAIAVFDQLLKDGREFRVGFSWHVEFSEDGERVVRILQYADAVGFVEFEGAVRELVAEEAGKESKE